jgi:hypothetical protein
MAAYSKESLMEIFGTPGVDPATVRRWKTTWRDNTKRLRVRSFTDTVRQLTDAEVDPLFYQFYSGLEGSPDGSSDASECYYVTFFKDEHYVFFKLHSGIA